MISSNRLILSADNSIRFGQSPSTMTWENGIHWEVQTEPLSHDSSVSNILHQCLNGTKSGNAWAVWDWPSCTDAPQRKCRNIILVISVTMLPFDLPVTDVHMSPTLPTVIKNNQLGCDKHPVRLRWQKISIELVGEYKSTQFQKYEFLETGEKIVGIYSTVHLICFLWFCEKFIQNQSCKQHSLKNCVGCSTPKTTHQYYQTESTLRTVLHCRTQS